MLSSIAGAISPIFTPFGFGDYRITTGIISGILAKEGVVSTLMVLFGSEDAILSFLSGYSVICLLVFCLLYTPCVAALSSIKRELGLKNMLFIAVFQFVVAWMVSGVFSLVFHIVGVM